MKNRLWEFLKRYCPWVVFGILCFLALSFLIFQEGTWAYLDLSYRVNDLLKSPLFFSDLFQGIMGVNFFGYDNSQILSTRFLNIFFQIFFLKIFEDFFEVFFILFYFILFLFFSKNIFSLFLNKKLFFLVSLFFVFNPISIFLLNEAGFFFVYFSLPLIIYAFIQYFKKNKFCYGYALLFALGLSLLTSYARVSFIYFGIIVFFGLIFHKELIILFIKEKRKLVTLVGISFLILLPIFFSFTFPYFFDDNYFKGVSNYTDYYYKIGEGIYENHLKYSFFQGFIPNEFTGNFFSIWQKGQIFQVFSLVYFLSGILFSFFILTKRKMTTIHRKMALGFLVIILGSVFLRMLAYFVNQFWFVKITYSYLPFLANTTSWIMLGFLVGFGGLLAFLLEYSNKKERVLISFFTLGYIFISLWPLIDFRNNPKLETISAKDIPKEYQIFSQEKKAEATLFFPQSNLYFNWSPYPINISRGKTFKELFSNNARLVNNKQVDVYEKIYQSLKEGTLANAYLFNLKNVFVFKDVRNDNVGFDFFPKKNYVQLSLEYYEKMKKEKSFVLADDNQHFAHFRRSDADKMDFFLYSPKTILPINPENFFNQGKIEINRRPVVVDEQAFHLPANLEENVLSEEVKVSSKYASGNTTKYFLKLENIEKEKPFLLQFNQTFGMSWKIKWVNKETFEKPICLEPWQNFSLSNNAVCRSDWTLFDWQDWKLLFAPEVPESQHFEGNFVGNTWLVRPQDIPQEMSGEKELYAVLIYEKQIYYIWTLIISGLTILILVILSGRSWWKSFKKKDGFENRKVLNFKSPAK